jgi:hypothetical protein
MDCNKETELLPPCTDGGPVAPLEHRADPIRVFCFADLKKAGIVSHWSSLRQLVNCEGFPPGILLSPGRRVWPETAIVEWLASRPQYVEPAILRGAAKPNAERARRRREVTP